MLSSYSTKTALSAGPMLVTSSLIRHLSLYFVLDFNPLNPSCILKLSSVDFSALQCVGSLPGPPPSSSRAKHLLSLKVGDCPQCAPSLLPNTFSSVA